MKQLNNNILRELGTLTRCIQSICDKKYKGLQLQKGQYIYLTRICENPGINFVELTMLLKMDKTSTTKAIQKLEAEGYIERKKDKLDKRIIRLYPCEKGLEVYEDIIDEENRSTAVCLTDFCEEERELANRIILKMRENIEAEWKSSRLILGGQEDD
jgi:DNA-binding MarR family transcriptional regulator